MNLKELEERRKELCSCNTAALFFGFHDVECGYYKTQKELYILGEANNERYQKENLL